MIKSKSGFTIVELLIVIVVIAILAAITIVAYNGIQDRARSSAAQSAAAQAKKKLEIYKLGDGNGNYPTTGNLSLVGLSESDGYQYTSNGATFCVTATNGNKSFTASDTSNPTQGGCAGHGQGGASAVTNLVRDPRATSLTAEWQNRYGSTRSFVANTSDGPLTNVNSYMRQTFSTSNTGSGRGTDHRGNMDTTPQSDTTWPVQIGDNITAISYLRASIASPDMRMICRIHDGGGNWVSATVSSSSFNAPAAQWTKISLSLTSSANGYLACSSRIVNTLTWTVGATIDTSALMINKQSSSNYADGNSLNWVWNGTANNASSTGPAL